jgi:hypothetical protein
MSEKCKYCSRVSEGIAVQHKCNVEWVKSNFDELIIKHREIKRLAKEYHNFMEIQGYEAQHQDILDFRCEVKNGS